MRYITTFSSSSRRNKEFHDIDENFVFRYISHLSKEVTISFKAPGEKPLFPVLAYLTFRYIFLDSQ